MNSWKIGVPCIDLADHASVLEKSEKIIRLCFERYKVNEVFLSFNGGKDCTVLLDITLNILKDLYPNVDVSKALKVVYIKTNNPFVELEEFVQHVQRHYGVSLITSEGEIKSTIQKLLDEDANLKAGLLGTRRSDPYSENMDYMQMTDANWPQIMRVSPLLDWSYHQIWSYILHKEVPYCDLYNRGYTSIGNTLNTFPNPTLEYQNSLGCHTYHPAWKLEDGSLERLGRKTGTNKPPITNILTTGTVESGHMPNGIGNLLSTASFCQNANCKMI